ncbi:hypothetical protein [Streptomyces anthocyanicus]|nr:hypothetical protein OH747_00060 [Streptomyces anthocyanicus]
MTQRTRGRRDGQKGKIAIVTAAVGGFFAGLGRAVTEWLIATFTSSS